MGCLREELRFDYPDIKTTTVHPFFISPPQKYKHWDIKYVIINYNFILLLLNEFLLY